MKSLLLIFPHQLFSDHPGFKYDFERIALVEEAIFFKDTQYPVKFHKQKLVLHRASLQNFKALLEERGKTVDYFEFTAENSSLNKIFEQYKNKSYQRIIICEVVDYTLKKRLEKSAAAHDLHLEFLDTPLFLNTTVQNKAWIGSQKKLLMADFYKQQRQKLDILMEGEKPTSAQWSYDEANRKKLPKNFASDLPSLHFPAETETVKAAKKYIETHFPHNYGSVETFYYPTTHTEAKAWLESFLKERFKNFGPYEDAFEPGENWLYHSVLTPMLNIGLLTPQQVLDTTLDYTKKNDIPLASLEGFIRQIIGWREFMRLSYECYGVPMRTTNHWQHQRKMPAAFYTGETGIEPVDDCIKRVLETGYCHHIERLMVLGGFMFLCEIDPDDIYEWFMEMFVDSYDWVMVPNVYAMSQNADGGIITTKPYFSGSNYVKKMSHYKDGAWADIWDALYWNWILKNSAELKKNYRWSMMVAIAHKMDKEKKQKYQKVVDKFLSDLS